VGCGWIAGGVYLIGVLLDSPIPASDSAVAESPLEPVHPAAGVQNLLLAGVERMALGTDLDQNVPAQRGLCLDHVAATASRLDRGVLWMNVRLHNAMSRLALL